jgi:competence protein CoiA-like protein
MPLRCQSPDGPVYAFLLDDVAWEALVQANRAAHHLTMPCCQASVVLKSSSLGTRFFAHKSAGQCTTQPESREHLLAKDIIARAAVLAGWTAVTECRDSSNPPAWIADVLCRRPARSTRVAFEVQLARQSAEETERRQSIYAGADIRSLWLMHQRDLPVSKQVPAFRVVFSNEARSAEAWLPGKSYSSLIGARTRITDADWGQRIELGQFVRGALAGALRFDPLVGSTVPVSVALASTSCFKCHRDIRILTSLTANADAILPGLGSFTFGLDELDAGSANAPAWIAENLSPERLAPYHVGPIERRYSHTLGERYLSNGCIHCGVLQGRFFSHEALDFEPLLLETKMQVTSTLLECCDDAVGMRRWWFDESKTC